MPPVVPADTLVATLLVFPEEPCSLAFMHEYRKTAKEEVHLAMHTLADIDEALTVYKERKEGAKYRELELVVNDAARIIDGELLNQFNRLAATAKQFKRAKVFAMFQSMAEQEGGRKVLGDVLRAVEASGMSITRDDREALGKLLE